MAYEGCNTGRIRTMTSYDENPSNMTKSEIQDQHADLLRWQKDEVYKSNMHNAKDLAKRRMDLWNEAQSRGIDL